MEEDVRSREDTNWESPSLSLLSSAHSHPWRGSALECVRAYARHSRRLFSRTSAVGEWNKGSYTPKG